METELLRDFLGNFWTDGGGSQGWPSGIDEGRKGVSGGGLGPDGGGAVGATLVAVWGARWVVFKGQMGMVGAVRGQMRGQLMEVVRGQFGGGPYLVCSPLPGNPFPIWYHISDRGTPPPPGRTGWHETTYNESPKLSSSLLDFFEKESALD